MCIFGAPVNKESECYWSQEFQKTAAYYAMLLITKSIFKKIDIQRIKNQIFDTINSSIQIDRSVLLAMDEVYDDRGVVHPEWTHLYVPNNYIVKLANENNRILFGCSVHPYRPDWQEQLDYSLGNQTVLCKWIPSSQQIDPTSEKCLPFYQKLAHHKLPLLCHAGPEYAIPTSNKNFNRYNNPKFIRTALEQGVVVIIAHCALPYFWFFDADYQDDFREFMKLVEEADQKGWQLYADISAMATPLRAPYIKQILDKVQSERLLLGSDYPIPLSELTYNRSKNFFSWLKFTFKVMFMKNQLDKNYLVLQKMGFDKSVFTNAAKLFLQIKYR
jgi:predicted TIM-barrel fold metal-dependent hydrolase